MFCPVDFLWDDFGRNYNTGLMQMSEYSGIWANTILTACVQTTKFGFNTVLNNSVTNAKKKKIRNGLKGKAIYFQVKK